MGQVFLAEDTSLGRRVAIKRLLKSTPDHRDIARFEREARATAALSHPNIVSIFELGSDDGVPYVVMEWLEGQTLREKLALGPLPLAEALDCARDMLHGVAAAHDKGICHRDLKPENVFITTDGRLKILDFGLAQFQKTGPLLAGDADRTATLVTSPGMILGTVAYMSPEQIRGDTVDLRSDVFALGMILFEMLAGVRLFREPSAFETMHAILTQAAPLDRIDRAVPADVVAVVRRCLQKDPSARFESAREVAQALAAARSSSPGTSSPAVQSAAQPALSAAPGLGRSVAVLPFANMSGDPAMEYFSDGVSEEVINAIAQLKGLQVAARTSSFAFKGKNLPIRDVGAALNVATVLEGSVRRSGERLRITAQLVDVATGFHLWSERYDRLLDDVFAIQEDIASNIMKKLEIALSSSAIARPAANIEAYDLYLKGRYLVEQRGDGLVKGLEHFKRAVAVDPGYAPAYAGIAETLAVLAVYGLVPPASVFPDAKAAAMRALQLDDRLAEAHSAMALVSVFHDWDWEAAGAEFDRALDINPNLVPARYWKGLLFHQLARGEMAEAIRECERAVELDPVAMLPEYSLGIVLINAGRPESAIVRCEASLEANPAQFLLLRVLAVAYLCTGRHLEAIAALERGTELARRHSWFVSELGGAYALAGRTADAERMHAELVTRAGLAYVSPISLALTPLLLGRVDEAVDCFERAFAGRDPLLVTTTAWPLFGRARKDRRVQILFERLGVRWTP